MNKILLILTIICLSISAKAQYNPAGGFGASMPYIRIDSGCALPFRDTVYTRGTTRPGLVVCRPSDSSLYYWNGKKWMPVNANLSSLIALINTKVDSITLHNDSLFYWVNGVPYGYVYTVPTNYWNKGNSILEDHNYLLNTGNGNVQIYNSAAQSIMLLDSAGYYADAGAGKDGLSLGNNNGTQFMVMTDKFENQNPSGIVTPYIDTSINGILLKNNSLDNPYIQLWTTNHPGAIELKTDSILFSNNSYSFFYYFPTVNPSAGQVLTATNSHYLQWANTIAGITISEVDSAINSRALLKANNLSDLSNTTSAKINIGVEDSVSTGVTTYALSGNTLLEGIMVHNPTAITISIGTTMGGNDIVSSWTVSGYKTIDVSKYYSASTTLYFTGLSGSSNFKIYKR